MALPKLPWWVWGIALIGGVLMIVPVTAMLTGTAKEVLHHGYGDEYYD